MSILINFGIMCSYNRYIDFDVFMTMVKLSLSFDSGSSMTMNMPCRIILTRRPPWLYVGLQPPHMTYLLVYIYIYNYNNEPTYKPTTGYQTRAPHKFMIATTLMIIIEIQKFTHSAHN